MKNRLTGEEFCLFLVKHGLQSMAGYKRIGRWLYFDNMGSVRLLRTRGCSRAVTDLILFRMGKKRTGKKGDSGENDS